MLPEILFGGLAGHQFVGPDGEATSVCAVRRDGPLQAVAGRCRTGAAAWFCRTPGSW